MLTSKCTHVLLFSFCFTLIHLEPPLAIEHLSFFSLHGFLHESTSTLHVFCLHKYSLTLLDVD